MLQHEIAQCFTTLQVQHEMQQIRTLAEELEGRAREVAALKEQSERAMQEAAVLVEAARRAQEEAAADRLMCHEKEHAADELKALLEKEKHDTASTRTALTGAIKNAQMREEVGTYVSCIFVV